MVGSEREKKDEVIKVTTGSMYSGEALYYMVRVHGTYYTSFQPVQAPSVFPYNPARFFLIPVMKAVSSMTSFFLALALFPQVQRRAQVELDAVVGRDRLPALDDRSRLPYIEAFCKELMRWQMVTPIGTIRSPL